MGPVGSKDVHHAFLGNKDTHEGSWVTCSTHLSSGSSLMVVEIASMYY